MIGKCRFVPVVAGVVFLVVAGFSASGCASGPAEESSGEQRSSKKDEKGETSEQFGDDPMGAVRRWTAKLPESAPERFRDRISAWSEPVVARLFRRDSETYRAVVLPKDEGDAEGLLITVERGEDGWRVADVESVGGRHGWTSY